VNLKFLCSILVNLFGAYDPKRPPNQAKRGTLEQIGPILWLDESRWTIC